jgi:hypothetical protein
VIGDLKNEIKAHRKREYFGTLAWLSCRLGGHALGRYDMRYGLKDDSLFIIFFSFLS